MVLPLTTSENVYLSITTALGKDAFILNKFHGTERFCDLFEFQAELYTTHKANASNNDIDFTALLQKEALIEVRFQDTTRHIHGIVTRFAQGATVAVTDPAYRQHERTYYYLTLRPKLWIATLRENCKIFQNMTTLDIIKEVLADHNIFVEDHTSTAGKEVREYCVQYNESDFQFISRLMEAEGIYYFFMHEAGRHTLTLCDNSKPFPKNNDFDTVPNILNASHPSAFLPGLFDLRVSQEVVSSIYTTHDYDFEKPTSPLTSTSQGTDGIEKEVYTYPGDYKVQTDGTKIADRRLLAMEFPFAYCTGKTNIPLLQVGTTFKLTNCPRATENKKDFVVFEIQHEAKQAETNDDLEKSLYSNNITFFHKTQVYAPPLKTPRPKIYGTQTAIVTGKAGEEIWTDKYGRVLVKFHWDLSDTQDDKTSCWIRVSQGWVGNSWGILFTPRIGQEVVVSFLNGNPDYPLITGCVYNGDNLPPYLPDTPTKSTIMTNSSKGGDGFNELRFEDLKDSEQIYMHAQKDLDTEVFNGNRTCTLLNAGGEGGNDTLTLKKGNRTMTLNEGNETIQLDKGDRSVTLTQGNETITLQQGNQTITLQQGNQDITLAGGNQTTTVTGNVTTNVTGNYDLIVGGNMTLTVTGNITIMAQGTCTVQAMQITGLAQTMAQVTADTIMLTGQSAITLAAASITGNATGALTMVGTGTAVLQSSASAAVSAPAVVLGG